MKHTLAILAALTVTAAVHAEHGLVAHWTFDEGKGDVAHDSSGNGNDGTLFGARWIEAGGGHAVSLDGWTSYVDCGEGKSLDIRGPVTVSAWVRPTGLTRRDATIAGRGLDGYAITAYRGGSWWYVAGGGNNVKAPFDVLQWQHVVGTFDGRDLRLYVNGMQQKRAKSKEPAAKNGGRFLIGRLSQGGSPGPDCHFAGDIDEVKVFNRALSTKEVVAEYNRLAKKMDLAPRDPALAEGVVVKPFVYPAKRRVVAQVFHPCLEPGARIRLELLADGDTPIAARELVAGDAETEVEEATFDMPPGASGTYAIRATVTAAEPTSPVKVTFAYPPKPPAVPDASVTIVPPLPKTRPPVEFSCEPNLGGGLTVQVGEDTYEVESTYSFPGGGENRLTSGEAAGDEKAWKVTVDRDAGKIQAEGEFYRISRSIRKTGDRIVVRDTFTNKTDDVLGIILKNRVSLTPAPRSFYAPDNGTLFVATAKSGLAVVALDDVFRLQQRTVRQGDWGAMLSEHFGLDAGASHTVEWDIYPTATNDYLEFINRVRRAEGLNRCVEGAFGLISRGLDESADRRTATSPKEIEAKGLKYVSFFYLNAPADDPGMSLEGFEFPDYPKECALLKETTAETHRINPGVKCMFHIAHGLFATHEPEKRFPDSRVIKENGKQLIYGPDSAAYYTKYFSQEKFDQGNRWWIYYPTLENSFGKRMLDGTDFMLNEIGTGGMYADGFVSGYARGYTYNAWDGHSVVIDAKTKKVTKKIGNVTLMSLPVLKKVAQKIAAKDGVLITNGRPGPRSLWEESYITTCESSGGDAHSATVLYLGPAVTLFGDPTRIHDRRTLYLDVLDKIQYGALYFYYGDKNYAVEEPLIVRHMYPFTLQELGRGWMKGEERIITRRPGVYGWEGDNHLHRVWRSDARGILVENHDFGTVADGGVRTELRLAPLECAVVEKLPVRAIAKRPVNFLVTRFCEDRIAVAVSDTKGISFEKDPDYEGRIVVKNGGNSGNELGTRNDKEGPPQDSESTEKEG